MSVYSVNLGMVKIVKHEMQTKSNNSPFKKQHLHTIHKQDTIF